MEKLEIYFLKKVIPWFLNTSKIIGILVICSGLTYLVSHFWGWDPILPFFALPALVFSFKRWILNNRIERVVRNILRKDKYKLKTIRDESGKIDYFIFNEIKLSLFNELKNENLLISSSFEIEGDIKKEIVEKIESIIWEEFRKNDL